MTEADRNLMEKFLAERQAAAAEAASAAEAAAATPAPAAPRFPFTPVSVRPRFGGWTPEKQERYIDTLAETICVDTAAKSVGMSKESAYALRRRPDAQSFRLAWEAALDYGVRRLADALFARALHGVPVPHYYKGELVGEHRRYDNRLAMWLLRLRDPVRYGRANEQYLHDRHPDGEAILLVQQTNAMVEVAHGTPGPGQQPVVRARRDLRDLTGELHKGGRTGG